MSRRVLVVGAAGFLGRHLVHALHAEGWLVRVQERTHKEAYPSDIEVIDAAAPPALAIANCDAVTWLASGTTPASSANDCRLELQQNLAPLAAALHAMHETTQAPHLVYVSSGGTLYGDVDAQANESALLRPRSYYAAGKAAAEQFIAACTERSALRATILRPSNVYGPGQTLHGGFGVIPAAMDCLLQHKPMTIWGDGSNLRNYLYVDDFTEACSAVLRQAPLRRMNVYNVASNCEASVNELLTRIEKVSGRQLQREFRDARGMDVARVALDSQQLRRNHGWTSRIGLDEGLRRTWEWARSRHQC
jgi:UDP-glucose 4-epimerase